MSILDLATAAATPMKSKRGAQYSSHGKAFADTFRWGVYTRISDDRLGDEKGVGRQQEDGVERVAQRGGHVALTYQENDTSAYKRRRIKLRDEDGHEYIAYRVIRPVFQQAIRDLREGLIDGLMVYDLDRLARDPRDLEDCIEMVENFRRVVESTSPGQVDLTNSNGIAMARVLVAMANKSSADTARRTERAHYGLALEGKPVGGRRPFGWEDDKMTVKEEEAAMIRDAADRLLSGQGLATVAAIWNESGVKTPRGKTVWRRSTLIEIMTNPRLCGFRTYHDEVMIGKDGKPVIGQWETILDQETWERLYVRLTRRRERGNRVSPPGGTARKYAWSGILKCGKPTEDGGLCGMGMVGYPRAKGHSVGFSYACRPKSDGGCGGLSVSGLHVDEHLKELILLTADERSAVSREVAEPWPNGAALEAAQNHLMELGDMFTARELDRAEYLRLREAAKAEVSALQAERAEWDAQAAGDYTPVENLRERWDVMPVEQKQTVARGLGLTAVIVTPSRNRGSRTFDPSRLEPVWA